VIVAPGPLRIVSAYPDLTLPQADDGNVLVLAHRARARGIAAEVRTVRCGEELPPADVYVTGGLEDEDQADLAFWLGSGDMLHTAVVAGAAVLAVNSGFQVLGARFALPDGVLHEGLGLLDVSTSRGEGFIEGPVVTCPNARLGLPALSGYESHFGRTTLGPGAAPLAELEVGRGNAAASPAAGSPGGAGAGPAVDGAVCGRVMGTYLHGPVLARNPELADLLLSWATGLQLEPLPRSFAEDSREARIDDARRWAAAGRKRVKM
jgi:lipid II isoglutaminyl synthase (glutamine-hydrolysing)